jgi:hypothetical protein
MLLLKGYRNKFISEKFSFKIIFFNKQQILKFLEVNCLKIEINFKFFIKLLGIIYS